MKKTVKELLSKGWNTYRRMEAELDAEIKQRNEARSYKGRPIPKRRQVIEAVVFLTLFIVFLWVMSHFVGCAGNMDGR